MTIGSRGVAATGLLRRAIPRAVLLTGIWWVLTAGGSGYWPFAPPFILGATLLSLALAPTPGRRLSPGGLLRFAPFFLWQSAAGGLDVALRALRPSLPLDPTFIEHKLRLPRGPARVFVADAMSLLPGTLSAELEGAELKVHALTAGPDVVGGIERLESRVADLFGVDLDTAEDPNGTR